MGELKPKLAASIRKIRRVFMHEWDPIGIGDVEGWPEDECDAYVMPIYSILRQQKGEARLPRIWRRCTSTSGDRAYRQRSSSSPRESFCRSMSVRMRFTTKQLTRGSRRQTGVIPNFHMIKRVQSAAKYAAARRD